MATSAGKAQVTRAGARKVASDAPLHPNGETILLVEDEQFVVGAGGGAERGGQRRVRGVVAEPFLGDDGDRSGGPYCHDRT